MNPTDPNEAALQDEWLRRVAFALVRNADVAEDLVQDAWVAALEGDRTRLSDRPWLAGVVRNRAFSLFRTRSRHRDRERGLAPPEPAPAADEVAAQLQLRERVARELNLVEEPLRTALYLRFVEGLSMREVARRLDVALSTANARVHKGLARLRQRMDAAHGGDRSAWAVALLPWARRVAPLTPLPTALVTMIATTTVAAGALYFAGVLPSLSSSPVPPAAPAAIPPAVSLATMSVAEPGPEPDPIVPAPVRLTAEARTPATFGAEPTPAAAFGQASNGAHVRARILLPDGTPATGVTWTLQGNPGKQQALLDHGEPEDWTDPTGVTDASGLMQIDFDSHPALDFSLVLDHPEFVAESWRWIEIGEYETKELGDVTLRAPGTIRGRVVGPDGAALTARPWHIYAEEDTGGMGLGPQPAGSRVSTSTDGDEAACFTLERMPAGPVKLKLYDKQLGWVDGPTVTVVAGTAIEIDFPVTEMEAFANAVVVSVHMRPHHAFPEPKAEQIWLVSPNGDRRHARKIIGRAGGYRFEDVGPEVFRLEVDDPRLAPWQQNDVVPGALVTALLMGSAALDLSVTAPDGTVIEDYTADVHVDGARYSPASFRAADAERPLVAGRLEGLIPGDYTITIRADGFVGAAKVTGLIAQETRRVEIDLGVSATASGTVHYPDGSPAAGILVRSVIPAQEDDSLDSPILGGTLQISSPAKGRNQIARAITDSDGAFTVALGDALQYRVVTGESPGPMGQSDLIEAQASTSPDPLHLVLERPARIEGSLAVPEGLSASQWSVLFIPGSPPGSPPAKGVLWESVGTGGTFLFSSLKAQAGSLVLLQGEGGVTFQHGSLPDNARLLTELALLPGETLSRSFDYPGELPVPVSFALPSGVAPEDTVSLWVERTPAGPTGFVSGRGPVLGPIWLEPGPHSAFVIGGGWMAQPTGLHVPAGGSTEVAIDLELTSRRVRAMLADSPIASATIEVSNLPKGAKKPRYETDADGYFELRLGPGTYQVHVATDDLMDWKSASLNWPLAAGSDVISFTAY